MRTCTMSAAAVLVLLACVLTASQAAELSDVLKGFGPPVMWVPKPAQPPVIDGKLDDKAWEQATPVTLRFLVGGWDMPSQKTVARVLADDKAIYFAVQCDEPHPELMNATGDRRDGALWSGDTVEFFLDPGHKSTRGKYAHIIINPKALIYDGKDGDTGWNANLTVAVGKDDAGWTVELAVPMKDLGVAGAIPKVWGLNVNRQLPELGAVSPTRGISGHHEKIKEPAKYRFPEDSAWSPTQCYSSHIPMRFGHAVLEAGTVEVKPPDKLFELIYKNDFDDGKIGPFDGAVLSDDNFRGPGKSIALKEGSPTIFFNFALKDLDDVTLITAIRLPQDGRLYYYGRAPDGEQCEADRHEVFMTPEQAKKRSFPAFDDYDTHGSMMAWKSFGRLRKTPGPWAMMSGHFSEPSIGSVMMPGTDWAILRTRIGQLRRQRSQAVVPLSQDYPRGLTFNSNRFLLDEFVVFRGMDLEPPDAPAGLKAEQKGDDVVVSWNRAKDNTITAYYRIYAGDKAAAETHQLSATVKAADLKGKPVTVTAWDLYENESKPSAPITPVN